MSSITVDSKRFVKTTLLLWRDQQAYNPRLRPTCALINKLARKGLGYIVASFICARLRLLVGNTHYAENKILSFPLVMLPNVNRLLLIDSFACTSLAYVAALRTVLAA